MKSQNHRATLGSHWSFNFRNDPKRLAFVLARYQFAAQMARKNADVLELGCSEGIGASMLAKRARSNYTGVDLDEQSIKDAQQNFRDDKYTFIYDDFLGKRFGSFGSVVSLDVIEHIYPEHESAYFETVLMNMADRGVCVIGTPNITAAPYASEASNLGHVNLYSQQRLAKAMQRYFTHVFPFGMNDEVVHTGFAPMAHYIFCVGSK